MDVRSSNAFRELMEIRGNGMPEDREVIVMGNNPFFRSPFKFGETVAAALSARAVAANDLWEIRTGRSAEDPRTHEGCGYLSGGIPSGMCGAL